MIFDFHARETLLRAERLAVGLTVCQTEGLTEGQTEGLNRFCREVPEDAG